MSTSRFHLILITLAFSFAAGAWAKDYPYFVTDDGHIFEEATNGPPAIKPEKIEQAKQASDSRPAGQDIEGNWGQVISGCQTSLRFAKSMFSTNEPIIATLIVRNVSEKDNRIFFRPIDDPATCIIVIGPQGNELDQIGVPKKNDRVAAIFKMSGPTSIYLAAGIQRKFEIDLKPHFDLSAPGQYVIYAQPRVRDPAIPQFSEIQSGNAVIVLTNSFASTMESPGTNTSK